MSRILTLVVALAAASPAAAKEDTPLAKQHYNLGAQLYNRADYKGALKQFQESYRHSKEPALLFNIGRCLESLGRLEQAIQSYEQFLASGPDDPETVQARVDNLKRLLEQKRKQEEARTKEQREAVKPPAPATAPPPGDAADHPFPGRRSGLLGTLGWISAGTGAALVISGVVMGALASGKAGDMEEANQEAEEYADLLDTEQAGKNFQLGQIITLSVGAAALVTSGVLLYLHYSKRQDSPGRRAWVAPIISGEGALIGAGLRF